MKGKKLLFCMAIAMISLSYLAGAVNPQGRRDTMGARKPLELQTKHLTKEERAKKELEQNIILDKEALKIKPDWLIDEVARKEWDRLVREFEKSSLVCNLDYNNLGAYCNAFAKWRKATEKIGLKIVVGKQTNPYVALELKYSEEMRKYAGMLGLSYESKLKSMQLKRENKESDIKDDFGDI